MATAESRNSAEALESIGAARELIRSALAVASMMLAIDEEFDVPGESVAGVGGALREMLKAAESRLVVAETLIHDEAASATTAAQPCAMDADEQRMLALFLAFVRRLDPAQRHALAVFLDSVAGRLDQLSAADWWVLTGDTPKRAAP